MTHMDELDLSIPVKRVDDRIQSVSDDSVAALHTAFSSISHIASATFRAM
jgi:hypothetical protein